MHFPGLFRARSIHKHGLHEVNIVHIQNQLSVKYITVKKRNAISEVVLLYSNNLDYSSKFNKWIPAY